MLLLNAMRTTALHANKAFTLPTAVSDSTVPETPVSATVGRSSATPAPSQRGGTPRPSQDMTSAKGSTGGNKKKKKEKREYCYLIMCLADDNLSWDRRVYCGDLTSLLGMRGSISGYLRRVPSEVVRHLDGMWLAGEVPRMLSRFCYLQRGTVPPPSADQAWQGVPFDVYCAHRKIRAASDAPSFGTDAWWKHSRSILRTLRGQGYSILAYRLAK